MEDKEILAELKRCYEYLTDIKENGNAAICNGQLKSEAICSIETAIDEIAKVYYNFRKTLNDEDMKVVINNEDYYIGKYIDEDYAEKYDEENKYTYWKTCADLDYFWYNGG